MRILIIVFLLSFFQIGFAQQYDPLKIAKKNKALYAKALEYADQDLYQDALSLINIALENEPTYLDAQLSKAGILGELKRYAEAVKAYSKAFVMDSAYAREYLLPYSINLAGMGNFEEALKAAGLFLLIPKLNENSVKAGTFRKNNYAFAVEQSRKHSQLSSSGFRNAGDAINSVFPEYFPSLTIDEKTLVFTRRVNGTNEEFYEANAADNRWVQATPLKGTVNTPFNEGAQHISQDGKWLVYAGCNFPDGYGSCDIYISILTASGWSKRENLGEAINSEAWESTPCLSPDKQELYFSSNRPGGYGGSDIYVSRLRPNGRWSSPQNLGQLVNTAGDESAPFMHADNETLYFTSSGLQGYGGKDIFFSKKRMSGFDTAVNLGYPINTIDNEGGLIVAANGVNAFYSSDRADSRGGQDIYTFELREDLRPLNTTWVQGKVYDSATGKGLSAIVELIDLSSKRVVTELQTDADGNYLSTLPLGRNYAFSVNKKGYLFYSNRFMLKEVVSGDHFEVNIPLQPFAKGANIVLRNILFETGKFVLLSESMTELDKIVSILRENPALKVQISGHTDNVGKDADNLVLSASRAKAVVEYIITKGILAARLTHKGFGAAQPVADNSTEQGRSLNRRTEMTVISNN
jgi:outer membrane protein OmpA-like peptidoglycan-associated protein/tetratricopeptide (TPR) repeat protein